jgi:hypothetical protein
MDSGHGLPLWRSLRWLLPLLSVLLAGAASAPAGRGTTGGETTSDGGSPQQQCGPMDVAFVIDVTGSMGPPINNVKAAIPQLLSQVEAASGGDYRAELVVFRDDINVLVPFASRNREAIESSVSGLFASGGNNEPEASDEALRTVIDALGPGQHQTGTALPFRSSVVKISVLITDAHPGGFDDTYTVGVDDVNANQRALDAAAAAIKISAVYTPSRGFPEADIVAIMQNYATRTSGIFVQTQPDGTGTADAIREVISACGGGPPPDGGTPDGGGGGGNGDVHYLAMDGTTHFDYHGFGCYELGGSVVPGSNVRVQVETEPWPPNPRTSIITRAALSMGPPSSPTVVILDVDSPHLWVGPGNLTAILGNPEGGESWVGIKEPGSRKLLGEVQSERRNYGGVIGYEYLATWHGGAAEGSQFWAIVFPSYGYMNVRFVPTLSAEGLLGNAPPRPTLSYGDGMGSTTWTELRSSLEALNSFGESWSTAVRGSLFPTGCPGLPIRQDAPVTLSQQEAAQADAVCRMLGVTDGPQLGNCRLDVAYGGTGIGVTTHLITPLRAAGVPVGTPESIPPPISAPDAGAARMMRTGSFAP